MTVRYHSRRGEEIPEYLCQREGIRTATRICQHVPGAGVDKAVGELLVATVSPMALEVALTQAELETRLGEADRLRHAQVERARYEAELLNRGPASDAAPAWIAAVSGSNAFGPVEEFTVRWEGQHDPSQLRALFSTFSPWLAMPDDRRREVLDDVERVAREDFNGRVVRPYRTVMHITHRVAR